LKTCIIIPQYTVFLEQLVVAQLVSRKALKFITMFAKAYIGPYPLSLRFNLHNLQTMSNNCFNNISSPIPRLHALSGLIHLGFLIKILYELLVSPMRVTCSSYLAQI